MQFRSLTLSRPPGLAPSCVLAFVLAIVPAAPRCQAITINAAYRGPGETLTGFGTAAAQPANAVGGGLLQSLVAVAANYWQSAFGDAFTLTVEYGWFPRSGTTTGTHILLSEGGTPHRELSAALAFDSDQSTIWFIDSTPASASEYTTFTNYTADLGGGIMNVGREYTGATGDAIRHDLLSTVLHEMGHALGLASANDAFVAERGDNDVDVTAPLPYAGSAIPLNAGDAHLNLLHPLMRSSRPSGVRRLASEADILVNAQISQFTQVNLNPLLVPEPSAVVLAGLGVLSLGALARRKPAAR